MGDYRVYIRTQVQINIRTSCHNQVVYFSIYDVIMCRESICISLLVYHNFSGFFSYSVALANSFAFHHVYLYMFLNMHRKVHVTKLMLFVCL